MSLQPLAVHWSIEDAQRHWREGGRGGREGGRGGRGGRKKDSKRRKTGRREVERTRERGKRRKRNLPTRLILPRLGKCCLQKVSDCGIHHLLPALGERWEGEGEGMGGGRGKNGEREG